MSLCSSTTLAATLLDCTNLSTILRHANFWLFIVTTAAADGAGAGVQGGTRR